jgi:hypothetical protein
MALIGRRQEAQAGIVSPCRDAFPWGGIDCNNLQKFAGDFLACQSQQRHSFAGKGSPVGKPATNLQRLTAFVALSARYRLAVCDFLG